MLRRSNYTILDAPQQNGFAVLPGQNAWRNRRVFQRVAAGSLSAAARGLGLSPLLVSAPYGPPNLTLKRARYCPQASLGISTCRRSPRDLWRSDPRAVRARPFKSQAMGYSRVHGTPATPFGIRHRKAVPPRRACRAATLCDNWEMLRERAPRYASETPFPRTGSRLTLC